MRVFVCAGMNAEPSENMRKDAIEIGRMLGQNNHTLLQGGSNKGMMGLTLNEFLKYSDDVEMIVPEVYKDVLDGLTYKKSHLTMNLSERLKTTIEQSDKIIVLPGGTGTLLELLYANETKRAKEHTCDVVVVNSDGFFDGLQKQIETMEQLGFTNASKIMVRFVKGLGENTKVANSIFSQSSGITK